MTVDVTTLIAKVREIYPEIDRNHIDISASFDEGKNAWIVTLSKGGDELYTHLEPEDAGRCLEGTECVHLGTQIGQFVEAYCLGSDACTIGS